MPEGSCLCGEIRFRVSGPLLPVVGCHCVQCRKTSGHYWAATATRRELLEISGTPKWYESTPGIKRGFCGRCGSSLFWDDGGDLVSIAPGGLDEGEPPAMVGHIFCASKGSYYEVADGLPQAAASDEEILKRGRTWRLP
ncbi:GFA family protein [Palleronia caenipelagi]|uniref:GFA family protein n=1 Tax=Palleronia caenipelagi TaxID=2489174 RepID=A0A547PS30_9RHOB|nr:GFA family protein [Palleronia caenipelagi]TRD16933.1 GFA family protein [Palleronia caenipelagi]